MTFTTVSRTAALLALALTLASCGGKATFPVAGTVSGLLYDGLVLNTNGMDLSVPAKATTFSFPNTLSYGEVYNVTQKNPPAHQTCVTVDPTTARETGTDTAGRLASINIVVSCIFVQHNISGKLTVVDKNGNAAALTVADLTLTNGSAGGSVTPALGATTFTFGVTAPFNTSYGVTVLTQPTGAVCTVANGTGVVADADVSDIAVTCRLN